jgi:hypothetical protein
MKKLLLGTALASAVLVTGSSFAETKVSGYVETTVGFHSAGTSSTADNSNPTAIGYESSIDIAVSKELDNGLTLSSGFGTEDGSAADAYLTLTSGNTSFSIGSDVSGVADNVSQEDFAPYIAQDIHTTGLSSSFGISGIKTTHNSDSFYLKHKSDMATIEASYSPQVNNAMGTASANGARPDATAAASGYDLAVYGNMGVEGLKVGYGISKATAADSSTADQEGKGYGVQYSMNNITVGYGVSKNQAVNETEEKTNTAYGIAYKVNDQLSVGLYQATMEDNSAIDEEYDSIQVGYDLGGMGITLSYIQAENGGGSAGTDEEKLEIRTVTKF